MDNLTELRTTVDNFEKSCEPMDIDMSGHSNNEMDISFNMSKDDINTNVEQSNNYTASNPELPDPPFVNNTLLSSNVKKFHIHMHREAKFYYDMSTKSKIFCATLILLLGVVTYQVLNIQCSDKINTNELETSLSNKLFGQSRAITGLIEALNVEERSKILFFYGGTGVGKTLTASQILEHVGYYSNVYHYTMPSFIDTFTTDFMMGLTVCKHTTVIVDDLSANDVDVKTHIKDLIAKSQNLDKNITVILIYNCDNPAKDFVTRCDESFPYKLLHNFNHIDAFKKLIKFETLKEQHLKKCIENELGNRKLNDIEFEKVMKNFNVSLDGCKGVYTKMKFLEIS